MNAEQQKWWHASLFKTIYACIYVCVVVLLVPSKLYLVFSIMILSVMAFDRR